MKVWQTLCAGYVCQILLLTLGKFHNSLELQSFYLQNDDSTILQDFYDIK